MTDVNAAPVTERSYGRSAAQLRPTTIEPGFVRTATGSALISMGETRVICTASVQDERAPLDGGLGPRLGHRRVRNAPGLHRLSASRATPPRAAPTGARSRSSA